MQDLRGVSRGAAEVAESTDAQAIPDVTTGAIPFFLRDLRGPA